MLDFLNKLLNYYNISYFDYLSLKKDVDFSDIKDPIVMKDIEETASYFKKAIKDNKKIIIYGDYDCDGIMATSIMYLIFKKLNYIVDFYIPVREKDGYGLNKDNITKFYKEGYNIIICVDNGITLVEEVDYLNSLGMECVIFDHHNNEEKLPLAKHIIHPILSGYGKENLSAGALCFLFSKVFLGYYDEYLLVLGAISLISDLIPLIDYNRTIVKLALKVLNKNKYENIWLLINDNEKNEVNIVNEQHISSRVAPRINAIGRIVEDRKINEIVNYFVSKNNMISLFKWMDSINCERKNSVNKIFENASFNLSQSGIIEIIDAKEGFIGLVTNFLMNKFKKPTIILCYSKDENTLKGSIRSKENFNSLAFLKENKDLLLSFGGHDLAGGLTLKKENYAQFKEKFLAYALKYPFLYKKDKYINISLGEINLQNLKILLDFAPFGISNPAPKFRIDNFKTNQFKFSKNKKHIITPLSLNASIDYFNFDEKILFANNVELIGYIVSYYYKNKAYVQFIVSDYRRKS